MLIVLLKVYLTGKFAEIFVEKHYYARNKSLKLVATHRRNSLRGILV